MMRSFAILAILFMVWLAVSCGKPAKEPPKPSKTVEDITGRTAIKQGEYMKNKIKEFEKNEQQRTDEALNRNE
jgi:hypothetical protein